MEKRFFAGKSDNSWKLWTLTVYAKWAEQNQKYIKLFKRFLWSNQSLYIK